MADQEAKETIQDSIENEVNVASESTDEVVKEQALSPETAENDSKDNVNEDEEAKSKAETQKEEVVQPVAASRTELERMADDHAAIQELLGLNKPLAERGKVKVEKKKLGVRPFVAIFVTICVIVASIAAWIGFEYLLAKQEEERAIAEHDRQIAEEEARRNRIEYADIAFLDSFPPNVAIAMDGKPLYARSQDGSYTELRARESTWIQNLPIKEDTVLKFSFAAEGFKPLTRSIAYYDWFPSNKPGKNPLQKSFKKIVLEPDVSPRVEQCAELPKIQDVDACEWTVFREIVFRERYAQAVKPLVIEETKQRDALKSSLALHPLLLQAATGFNASVLETKEPLISPDLPDATKSLLKTLTEHPYGLYGSITVETDSPDTRVYFMSEPLMVLKSTGSMSQVKVQPGEPYTFAVYGQGRPIEITQTLSLRLETNDAPAYVAEIMPHQWHCRIPDMKTALELMSPELAPEVASPDYRHYLCDYSIKISVDFKGIKEIESEAARQREQKKEQEAKAGASSEKKEDK